MLLHVHTLGGEAPLQVRMSCSMVCCGTGIETEI
jgi:hypothetical protein